MCFLIPILTGLLGALLGYLLGKMMGGGNDLQAQLDAELEKNRKLSADLNVCNTKFSQTEKDFLALKSSGSDWEGKYKALNADFDAHKAKFATLEGDYNSLKTSSSANADAQAKYNADLDAWKSKYASLEADYNALKEKNSGSSALGFASGSAVASTEKAVETSAKKDDLKIIEGIGPKIEELLNSKGIYTFAQLADAKDEDTQAILKEAGSRFQIHDATTWNEQAELARDGKWDELKALQDRLNAGRGDASAYVFDADSAKSLYGQAVKEDDLKIVEGIGPKIEELFHNAGIKTWKALSELSVEKCNEILATGGERFQMHDPGTWPKQCELAYQGKWEELKKWQDELDGGKA